MLINVLIVLAGIAVILVLVILFGAHRRGMREWERMNVEHKRFAAEVDERLKRCGRQF